MEHLATKEKCHFFMPDLAAKYGVSEAIVLNHLIFWIASNAQHGKKFHDERFWTFNSVRSFNKYFPYWSEGQIARILNSLIDQGIIIVGNFNRHKYDRTRWFALKDEKHFLTNYNPFDEYEDCKRKY